MKRITIQTTCFVVVVWIDVLSAPAIRRPFPVAMCTTVGVLLGVILLSMIGKALKRY